MFVVSALTRRFLCFLHTHAYVFVEHLHLNHISSWPSFEQGEAKSAELIGKAIANKPAFLALRQIEAAREIANTMATSNNRVFLDSNDLLLGLQQLSAMGKEK
jgi:hypothetical protein